MIVEIGIWSGCALSARTILDDLRTATAHTPQPTQERLQAWPVHLVPRLEGLSTIRKAVCMLRGPGFVLCACLLLVLGGGGDGRDS